ncbi:MAG: cytochrome c1 [Alphaproteobacteria bacterium]|nr:cytochrome c1 [Alphaproteobacteria bacterium]
MKNKSLCYLASLSLFCVATLCAQKDQADPIPKQDWSFDGITGTFKRDALQRGFQVYKEVCASCHGVKQLRFRELEAIGFTPAQVRALAASYTIDDGPNLEGEMFTRPGLPSDNYPSPYKNANQAKAANNGAYPVDLSLITKARKGGADYVYALLTGYVKAPAGFALRDGEHYNRYFAGRKIAMAAPLMMDDQVTYADGTKATISQMAKDVVTFLAFVSEPEMESRKRSGIQTLLYLGFMTVLLYLLKRRIWRDVK